MDEIGLWYRWDRCCEKSCRKLISSVIWKAQNLVSLRAGWEQGGIAYDDVGLYLGSDDRVLADPISWG